MDEREFRDWLANAIDSHASEEDVDATTESYRDAGILTRNKGLVVRTEDGSKFQVTVVRSR